MTKEEYKAKDSVRRLVKRLHIERVENISSLSNEHFTHEMRMMISLQSTKPILIRCINDLHTLDLEFNKVYSVPAFAFDLRGERVQIDRQVFSFSRFELVKE